MGEGTDKKEQMRIGTDIERDGAVWGLTGKGRRGLTG